MPRVALAPTVPTSCRKASAVFAHRRPGDERYDIGSVYCSSRLTNSFASALKASAPVAEAS